MPFLTPMRLTVMTKNVLACLLCLVFDAPLGLLMLRVDDLKRDTMMCTFKMLFLIRFVVQYEIPKTV